MLNIPGYQVEEELPTPFPFLLYKANRLEGNLPVLIKVPNHTSTGIQENQIYHEYCLTRDLNQEHTIHCLGYEKYSGGHSLILEDFISNGGKTLADWSQSQKLTIHSFLEAAILLAKGLEFIHSKRIIHKRIHPENIIVMSEDHSFKYFNFSLASRISLEEIGDPITNESMQQMNSPKYLFYTAPEQTGRISTTEGSYTDLYSLGICFYELLFGKPPFISEDPMEIVHAHIAKEPQWPSHRGEKEAVPEAIQKINAKLLEKNAEDRYQSAAGLKEDLQKCLNELTEKGRIDHFKLGAEDIINVFRIPVNFYGRSKEFVKLEASFLEVKRGKSRLHLVGGKRGIGKSTLVEEFGNQLSSSGAHFMSGKFNEDIPYSALIQAFQKFIRNILKQDQETVLSWKTKLIQNINPNLGLIIDLIPEVEFIVGEQNTPPNLPFQESKKRFQYIFKRFVNTFISPRSPLVIFLDDLHLAGPESLELINSLFEGRPSPFFLLIAAYRNNQEDMKTHIEEFQQYSLKTLPASFAKKKELSLQPMDLKSTYKLVRDSLITKAETIREEDIDTWVTKVSMMSTARSKKIQEKKIGQKTKTNQNSNFSLMRGEDITGPLGYDLAFVLFAKTDGNFMLAKEMLKQLYREEIISFDNSEKQWVWEIAKVRTFALSDDTLELLIQNLQKVEEEELEVLKAASVIGTSFNILILSNVCQKNKSEVFVILQELVQNGFIVPLYQKDIDSNSQFTQEDINKLKYGFVHPEIQKTALHLLSETEAEKTHSLVGKAYTAHLNRKDFYNHLTDIVNHLNKGYTFLRDEEKKSLMQKNLEAGNKAKKSLAYDIALNFFHKGVFFFNEVGTEQEHELIVSLNQGLGEIYYLRNEWTKAKKHFSIVLKKAKKTSEKLRAYGVQISIQTGENHFHEAVKIGFTALKSIDMRFPQFNSDKIRVQQLQKLKSSVLPQELLKAPKGKEFLQEARMKVLMQMSAPAKMISSALFALLTAEMLSISSKHGKNEITPYACVSCGSILFAKTKDLGKAFQFGEIALQLLTQMKKNEYSFSIYYMYASNILSQKNRIRDTIPYFRKAFSESLMNGAFEYASMSVLMIHFTNILGGSCSYSEIESEMAESSSFLDYYGHKYSQELFHMLWQYIRLMRGEGRYKSLFTGPKFDERKFIPTWEEKDNYEGLFYLYCIKSILSCLFHDYEASRKYAEKAWKYSDTILAFVPITTLKFFHCFSLICLGKLNKTSVKKNEDQHTVGSLMKDIKNLSEYNHQSFSHLYLLLQAREAASGRNKENAMNLYDKAIKACQENGFVFYEAFANEVALEFYLNLTRIRFAFLYYEEAKRLYGLYNISSKVNDLELRFHKRFIEELQPEEREENKEDKIPSSSENTLDMITVMKASQAISQEIRLERLLKKMVEILMESAGAQKVFLLLQENEEWKIQAEGSLDREEPFSIMQNIHFEENNNLDHAVIQYVIRTKETLAFANISEDKVFGNSSYVIEEKTRSLLCMPILLQGNFSGILYLENKNTFGAFTEERVKMLSILSSQISASLENAHLYSNLENALQREKSAREAQEKLTRVSHKFVPVEFLRELGQTEIAGLRLGTHVEKEMTVLFSDIRSFTNLSEEMTPEDNFKFINSYLEQMGPIVRSCGGFIDKYIGDAIMALFPIADKSIQSAVSMMENLISYNERRVRLKRRTIQIGVGIHTGNLMLGTVGEQERMQGTVISDSVNLAARLEGLTKMYGASIVTSKDTLDKMDSSEELHYRVLDTVQVKGKKLPTQVIEILDGLPPEEKEYKMKFLSDFQEGIDLYSHKKFEKAREKFQEIYDKSKDKATTVYLERCDTLFKEGIPKDWQPVSILTNK